MQCLASVIRDQVRLATADEMAAVDVLIDRLQAEGYWLLGGGLAAPGTATVIDNRGEEALVTDGPFLESKEYFHGLQPEARAGRLGSRRAVARSRPSWAAPPAARARQAGRLPRMTFSGSACNTAGVTPARRGWVFGWLPDPGRCCVTRTLSPHPGRAPCGGTSSGAVRRLAGPG